MFLDLDGTLAPIAPRPQDVGPSEPRNSLLRLLSDRLNGRLAIVSGRSIDDIDRIVESAIACVGGLHGLERRSQEGANIRPAPHPGLHEALARIRAFAADRPLLMTEDKGLSIALHFRGAPEAERDVLEFARGVAAATELALQEGAMVVELKTPGADKGDAVRAFMLETPFRGAVPIFVGDDLTDEHGFGAVQSHGGFGVLVGPRRQTAAIARLDDVEQVLAWIRNSLAAGAFELQVT